MAVLGLGGKKRAVRKVVTILDTSSDVSLESRGLELRVGAWRGGANIKRQKGRSCSSGARSTGREQQGRVGGCGALGGGATCQVDLGLQGEQRRAGGDFSLRSKVSKGCHQRKKYFLYFSAWNKHWVKKLCGVPESRLPI